MGGNKPQQQYMNLFSSLHSNNHNPPAHLCGYHSRSGSASIMTLTPSSSRLGCTALTSNIKGWARRSRAPLENNPGLTSAYKAGTRSPVRPGFESLRGGICFCIKPHAMVAILVCFGQQCVISLVALWCVLDSKTPSLGVVEGERFYFCLSAAAAGSPPRTA